MRKGKKLKRLMSLVVLPLMFSMMPGLGQCESSATRKLLITGFAPFGGESTNPSWEAVQLLPEKIGDKVIVKYLLPVEFEKSVIELEKAISKEKPDIVISVGQAGRRSRLSLEKVAVNYVDARMPDNGGNQPQDALIDTKGPTAYFATLPLKAMKQHAQDKGIPCEISMSAGTYVCNYVMYSALNLAHKKYPHMQVGFFHVPFSPAQIVDKPAGVSAMPVSFIAESIATVLEAI